MILTKILKSVHSITHLVLSRMLGNSLSKRNSKCINGTLAEHGKQHKKYIIGELYTCHFSNMILFVDIRNVITLTNSRCSQTPVGKCKDKSQLCITKHKRSKEDVKKQKYNSYVVGYHLCM